MTVSVNTAFQAILFIKKNINNIDTTNRLQMSNIVNSRIYDFVININAEDYILENTIFIQKSIDTYYRPDTAQNHMITGVGTTGIFKTQGGSRFTSLEYSTETSPFTANLPFTTTGGASGTIDQVEDNGTTGFLKLSNVDGDFTEGDIITDSGTGSATVVKATPYDNSDRQLDVTHANSGKLGYFSRGANYIFTPLPTSTDVFLDRFIPFVTTLTATTDNFVTVNSQDDKYLELIRDLLLVEYEIFDGNSLLEQNADARSQEILREFFNTINKDPLIYIFDE